MKRILFIVVMMVAAQAVSAWMTKTDTSLVRQQIKYHRANSGKMLYGKADSTIDTTGIVYNPTDRSTTFPGLIRGGLSSVAAVAETLVLKDKDTLKYKDKCAMLFPPGPHGHTAATLPESLKHHVAPLHFAVAKDTVHWKELQSRADTTYGDVFFWRNLYVGDSTVKRSLYMGILTTFTDLDRDSSILWFSPAGGAAERGPYMVFGGNESSYPHFLLSGGDSGDVIMSAIGNRRSVVSGGNIDLALNGGGGSYDYMRLDWRDVGHSGFYLFCVDTNKRFTIQQRYYAGPYITWGKTYIDVYGQDSILFNAESKILFSGSPVWFGSNSDHSIVDSNSMRGDTLEAYDAMLLDTTIVIVVSEAIPDDGLDSIFSISLPSGSVALGNFSYAIVASSSTLRAGHTGIVTFGAANEAGSISADIDEVYLASNETEVGTGSLTDTWSIVAGTDAVIVRLISNSALTLPTIRVRCRITLHSLNAVTPL